MLRFYFIYFSVSRIIQKVDEFCWKKIYWRAAINEQRADWILVVTQSTMQLQKLLMNFYHCAIGQFMNFIDNSKSCQQILMNFWGWDVQLAKKYLICVPMWIVVTICGFLTQFISLWDKSNCKNFASVSVNNDFSALWAAVQMFAVAEFSQSLISLKCFRQNCHWWFYIQA